MTAYLHALDPSGNLVPLHVDADGHLIISGDITIGDVTVSDVEISNDTGNPVPISGIVEINNDFGNAIPVSMSSPAIPGLNIPVHNFISLTYTGSDLTGIVYKSGGSGGTTVATLTLAYSNGQLASVTRS